MKLLYVLARDLSLFSLPGLRKIRNKIFSVHLGARNLNVDNNVKIQPLHTPQEASYFGDALHVSADCVVDLSGGMTVGDRVTISDGAKVYTHTHVIDDGPQDWRKNPVSYSSLEIGDDVWIGAGAIVLSSVDVIGAGAVIAAGSVLRKNVEPNSMMAGVPAKLIRKRRIAV